MTPVDFNSYGARRGHHEVMMRGTFGNIRLRNALTEREGPYTTHQPSGRGDVHLRRRDALRRRGRAADRARRPGVRQRLVARLGRQGHPAAGRARGPRPELRAHPSLEPGRHGRAAAPVPARRSARTRLGLTGRESFDMRGLDGRPRPAGQALRRSSATDRRERTFEAITRLDGPIEVDYYRQGGILPAVLRRLARA